MDIFDIPIKEKYTYESKSSSNKRIFYSAVSITTNFNVEQVFEHGQISIFENMQAEPNTEVEITFEDGLGNKNTVVVTGTKKWITK